jgi:hypothetical protein
METAFVLAQYVLLPALGFGAGYLLSKRKILAFEKEDGGVFATLNYAQSYKNRGLIVGGLGFASGVIGIAAGFIVPLGYLSFLLPAVLCVGSIGTGMWFAGRNIRQQLGGDNWRPGQR